MCSDVVGMLSATLITEPAERDPISTGKDLVAPPLDQMELRNLGGDQGLAFGEFVE